MTYDEVNKYFNNLKPFVPVAVKPGELLFDLDTVSSLANAMGNPQDKTSCVHITGTNGKGSVAAFISAILKSAGYKTGTFSSPYLSNRTEQIQINGKDISEIDFAGVAGEVIEKAKELSGENKASEFEITTVAAFEYFAKEKCDIAVIEVGMGGEYDATNIIKSPLLAVFTGISLEHSQVLGDSVEAITKVKSGIIKENTDVVAMENPEEVLRLLSLKCESLGGSFTKANAPENIECSLSGTEFDCMFEGSKQHFKLTSPGFYQPYNAGAAICAAEILKEKGFNISLENVKEGLFDVKRPARFELLSKKPVFIADGSHNAAAIDAMLFSLKEMFPDKKFIFITGVLRDKDYEEMLEPVLGLGKVFFTVTPHSPRGLPADKLAYYLVNRGVEACSCDSVKEAVDKAFAMSGEDDVIVAFGSLYYMGELRRAVIGDGFAS